MNASTTSNRKLTIGRAMHEAMAQEMRRDPRVFLMGEDIRRCGGVWGHTAGLVEEFGPERIRDTPICEAGFIGAAAGAAIQGMRPIVELMFVDFVGVCLDSIAGLAAKNSYFTAGRSPVPMVINTVPISMNGRTRPNRATSCPTTKLIAVMVRINGKSAAPDAVGVAPSTPCK